MVKYLDAITTTFPMEAGIPQGSVLGLLLFSIYTADLPISTEITIATFADDTALLASHANPIIASSTLQRVSTQWKSDSLNGASKLIKKKINRCNLHAAKTNLPSGHH